MAQNLGAKGIKITEEIPSNSTSNASYCKDWADIYQLLNRVERSANIQRKTHETEIDIRLNLNGTGRSIHTGIAFFDHMLDQLARHGHVDLDIQVKGDLEVDEHHTIEDTAIALGEAFSQALGNKLGIERYGFALPMDDCKAQALIDFEGGPGWFGKPTFKEDDRKNAHRNVYALFKSFADGAKANLNIRAEGQNEHHKIEAIFKSFAKAIKMAVRQDPERMILPPLRHVLMEVAIVDYGAGNVQSVQFALDRLGVKKYTLTQDPDQFESGQIIFQRGRGGRLEKLDQLELWKF